MQERKASRYLVQIVDGESGRFRVKYQTPAMALPEFVSVGGLRRTSFPTPEIAEAAALAIMADDAVERAAGGRPKSAGKMTARQLFALMAAAGVDELTLEYVLGARPGRVRVWLTGKDAPSHLARVILTIVQRRPESLGLAISTTDDLIPSSDGNFHVPPAKLSPRQLREEMEAVGLDAAGLAQIASTPVERVGAWLLGSEDAPHPITIVLALLRANPDLVEFAKRLVNDPI